MRRPTTVSTLEISSESLEINRFNSATVYIDGSALNNGGENVRAGCGVYYGENDLRCVRLPWAYLRTLMRTSNVAHYIGDATNQRAELYVGYLSFR